MRGTDTPFWLPLLAPDDEREENRDGRRRPNRAINPLGTLAESAAVLLSPPLLHPLLPPPRLISLPPLAATATGRSSAHYSPFLVSENSTISCHRQRGSRLV